MMGRVLRISTILLLGLFWYSIITLNRSGNPLRQEIFLVGAAMWSAYLFGLVARSLGQSRILGILVAGILLGPSLAEWGGWGHLVLQRHHLQDLALLNSVALGLIAFMAGGELKIRELRPILRPVFLFLSGRTLFLLVGGLLGAWLLVLAYPGVPAAARGMSPAVAVLLAVCLVPISPDVTIAVMNELHSQGPTSRLALTLVVLMDVVTLLLFAVTLPLLRPLTLTAQTGTRVWLPVLWELAGSIGFGLVLGLLMMAYMRWIQVQLELTLFFLALMIMEISHGFHLSGLIMCLTAGFLVSNASEHGSTLVQALENLALPVYVLFFFLSGARIELSTLIQVGGLAVGLVLLRILLTHQAIHWTSRLRVLGKQMHFPDLWRALVSQGGLVLGLGLYLESQFADFGLWLKNVIIGMASINLLLGPILLKSALTRAGEIGVTPATNPDSSHS